MALKPDRVFFLFSTMQFCMRIFAHWLRGRGAWRRLPPPPPTERQRESVQGEEGAEISSPLQRPAFSPTQKSGQRPENAPIFLSLAMCEIYVSSQSCMCNLHARKRTVKAKEQRRTFDIFLRERLIHTHKRVKTQPGGGKKHPAELTFSPHPLRCPLEMRLPLFSLSWQQLNSIKHDDCLKGLPTLGKFGRSFFVL